jgi:hypothetical protein
MLSFFSGLGGLALKFKGYIIAGLAVLALCAGSYGAGYMKAENHDAQKAVVSAKADTKAAENTGNLKVAAILQSDAKAQVHRVEIKVRDMARENQLQAQVDGLRSNTEDLKRLLNEKPDTNPACRVSLGDVLMLNAGDTARTPGGGTDGTPDPAVVAAYQDPTPSSVTCRDLVADDLAIRGQYATLGAGHDKLVDWVQVELIDPQVAKPESK